MDDEFLAASEVTTQKEPSSTDRFLPAAELLPSAVAPEEVGSLFSEASSRLPAALGDVFGEEAGFPDCCCGCEVFPAALLPGVAPPPMICSLFRNSKDCVS